MICYPCLRNGPSRLAAGGRTRTDDLLIMNDFVRGPWGQLRYAAPGTLLGFLRAASAGVRCEPLPFVSHLPLNRSIGGIVSTLQPVAVHSSGL